MLRSSHATPLMPSYNQIDVELLKKILRCLNFYMATYYQALALDQERRESIKAIAREIYSYFHTESHSVLAAIQVDYLTQKSKLPIPNECHVNVVEADKSIADLLNLIVQKVNFLLSIELVAKPLEMKQVFDCVIDGLIPVKTKKSLVEQFDEVLNKANIQQVKEAVHLRRQLAGASFKKNESLIFIKKRSVSYIIAKESNIHDYNSLRFLNTDLCSICFVSENEVCASLANAKKFIKEKSSARFYILELDISMMHARQLISRMLNASDQKAAALFRSHVKAVYSDCANLGIPVELVANVFVQAENQAKKARL